MPQHRERTQPVVHHPGELVLPTGGEAWTSAFIDVLGRLGVEEKAARQALMRTATDNWLSSERVGRARSGA